MQLRFSDILQNYKLRDTQSRRLVLQALVHFNRPISHKEIHEWIQQQDAATNLVTVYRTLEAFEKMGIVHQHPSSGGFIICSMHEHKGHHGFLSCEKCGTVEEFCDASLCSQEDRIAKQAGFTPTNHISDITGVCAKCQ